MPTPTPTNTINLGGLDLPSALVWLERYSQTTVVANERRTIGGKLRISPVKLSAGLFVTLEATEDHGWLTRDQVQALQEMASDPSAVYTLLFNGVSYSVTFRHSQAPTVSMQPLIARTEDFADDLFIGQIKLITL